jgi:hypothetical protein
MRVRERSSPLEDEVIHWMGPMHTLVSPLERLS